MEFRLVFEPQSLSPKITIHDKIFMIGSCFTEHIHAQFSTYKFQCLQNPHGTLFNPISIFNSIRQYIHQTPVGEDALFQQNGLWHHWDFHSKWSDYRLETAVEKMNSSIAEAHAFIKNADWLIITLGSGFVYRYKQDFIVANCHKVPAKEFERKMLGVEAIESAFISLYQQIKQLNPSLKIIFTISPVRHVRDGFVENNRSKAVLHLAVDKLVNNTDIFYFPSFELVVDDLRDYRFYAEDMVHPNYQATQYVWEKFCSACIDGKTRELMKEIHQLSIAMKHKPFHALSAEHKKFREKYLSIAVDLSSRFPSLSWEQEIGFFTEN